MTDRRAIITDHAMLRYLEQVEGVDIAAVRAKLAARLDEAVRMGASAVTIDGHQFRFSDVYCTTVVPRHMRMPRRNRSQREDRE